MTLSSMTWVCESLRGVFVLMTQLHKFLVLNHGIMLQYKPLESSVGLTIWDLQVCKKKTRPDKKNIENSILDFDGLSETQIKAKFLSFCS